MGNKFSSVFSVNVPVFHTQRPWIGGIVESGHYHFIIQYIVAVFSGLLADYLRDEYVITPISA